MSGFGTATEFVSRLDPPGTGLAGYDKTKSWKEQPSSIPQTFRDALAVREEVFGEQGVPLEVEVDEDDARAYHWVTYASVAQTTLPPPTITPDKDWISPAEEQRRSSATAQRVPVGAIRLIPPPHGPNPYKLDGDLKTGADEKSQTDEKIQPSKKHPMEPYIKLGRLSVIAPYRRLGLGTMLVNTALDYAANNHDIVTPAPSPTTMEALGKEGQKYVIWQGLVMIHAQVDAEAHWVRHGFAEELIDEEGAVEIPAEEHWTEEGIEHIAMWKRLKLADTRL
ncbi:hypothetical protein BCR34DRAFT_622359 [Clohesyomyces aquaticus]|uniref:N-acetyltransferase domain-containing protein n=1 Tax=Clohesyomyces aquaticus TaxID=1231657 RepID=A0A1Y2A253_9PLEO|nr:hypothetical protein BCR34DRAFT_622359 [Clohesyomyces aquaticus]